MNRRRFIASAVAAALSGSSLSSVPAVERKPPPRILLRGSWQSVNIGDIGHTPGALRLLELYFPEAEVTLWPGELGHGAREMLIAGFPRLQIAEGGLDPEGKPDTPALAAAWKDCDFWLNGSGSGFPAARQLAAWHRATRKPFGVFGVSTDPISGFGGDRDPEGGTLDSLRQRALKLPPGHLKGELRWVIDRAAFMFCRDSISRNYLKAQDVRVPILEFGPDAQLGMHLRDDARGDAFRQAHGLAEHKFICVIPRLRYTPYYSIKNSKRTASDDVKDAINHRTTDGDHAKLREMMVSWVRSTGLKVLACPEMTYQVQMSKEVLVDPLPEDVKKNVVWRDNYWLPDEAASVHAKAQAVISFECHSPLIALASGTPAFYVRQPTDTCKGQMYRDFGMDEWFFEVDETDGRQLWSRLSAIQADPGKARAKVKTIMEGIKRLQQRMVAAVHDSVQKL